MQITGQHSHRPGGAVHAEYITRRLQNPDREQQYHLAMERSRIWVLAGLAFARPGQQPPLAALRNAQRRRTPQARRHHHPSCQIARMLTHPRPAKFMQRNRCPCGTSVARFGLPQPDGPAQQGRRQASSSNLLPHESNPARQIRSGSIARNRMTAVITRRVQNVCWRGPPTGRRWTPASGYHAQSNASDALALVKGPSEASPAQSMPCKAARCTGPDHTGRERVSIFTTWRRRNWRLSVTPPSDAPLSPFFHIKTGAAEMAAPVNVSLASSQKDLKPDLPAGQKPPVRSSRSLSAFGRAALAGAGRSALGRIRRPGSRRVVGGAATTLLAETH